MLEVLKRSMKRLPSCTPACQHLPLSTFTLQAITKQLSLKRPDLVAHLRPSSSGLSPLASPNTSVEPPAMSGASGRGTSVRVSTDEHLQPEAPAATVGAQRGEEEGAGKLDASLKGLRSHPLDAADMALGVHLSRDASEEGDKEPLAKLESLPPGPGGLDVDAAGGGLANTRCGVSAIAAHVCLQQLVVHRFCCCKCLESAAR